MLQTVVSMWWPWWLRLICGEKGNSRHLEAEEKTVQNKRFKQRFCFFFFFSKLGSQLAKCDKPSRSFKVLSHVWNTWQGPQQLIFAFKPLKRFGAFQVLRSSTYACSNFEGKHSSRLCAVSTLWFNKVATQFHKKNEHTLQTRGLEIGLNPVGPRTGFPTN